MPRLEEIVYDAGRAALADQAALASDIRQRTGVLLAAHALVASFLGAAAIRAHGLHFWGWLAMIALVLGPCTAGALLAPWKLTIAVDARELYREIYPEAVAEAEDDTLGWLASAGYGYQALRVENAERVERMSLLAGCFGVLMIAQTAFWLVALAVK